MIFEKQTKVKGNIIHSGNDTYNKISIDDVKVVRNEVSVKNHLL